MMRSYGVRILRRSASCAAFFMLAACGGSKTGVPLSEMQPAQTSTVQPGDVIDIEFWQQAELSGDRLVDESGLIHLPLLRSVEVNGLGSEEIREKLTELYSQYYADPLIVVRVRLGVSVTGEIRSPGRYTVDPAFNVLDLFGQASGLTYEANREEIELNRNGRRYIVNLDDALLHTQMDKLRLQSGDWIYIPRRFWTLQRTLTYATMAVLVMSMITFFQN